MNIIFTTFTPFIVLVAVIIIAILAIAIGAGIMSLNQCYKKAMLVRHIDKMNAPLIDITNRVFVSR